MPRDILGESATSQNRRSTNYTNRRKTVVNETVGADFWRLVEWSAGCWLWRGPVNQKTGYGTSHHVYAHRLAWALTNGPIPDGQSVLHHCDVPACVNPAHLFLGTQLANMRDAASKGRLHVPRPRGQRVTDAEVSQILALAASGARQCDVARQFGVTKAYVSLLLKGKRRQYRKAS